MEPDEDMEGVVEIPAAWDREDMGDMCAQWQAETIVFPPHFGRRLVRADAMFFDSQVETILFPPGFGRQLVVATGMFNGCHHLSNLVLPDGFGVNLEFAGFMFFNTALREIIFPEGFGARVNDTMEMFGECDHLERLVLPDGFGAMETADRMFAECVALRHLSLPEGFGRRLNETPRGMFAGCDSLATIVVRGPHLAETVREAVPLGVEIVLEVEDSALAAPPPHTHPLRRAETLPSVAYLNGYRCDQCGRHGQIPIPARRSRCNFDLCDACFTYFLS